MRLPVRALLLGTAFCMVFAYVTTTALHLTAMTLPSTQISSLAFVFCFLLILAVNPLLRLLRRRVFTRAELFLVFIMAAVPAGLNSYGLIAQVIPLVGGLHNPDWNTPQSKWDDNVTPFVNPDYFLGEPLFQERDVRDWRAFANALAHAGETPSPLHRIWSLLPDNARKRVKLAAAGKDYTQAELQEELTKLRQTHAGNEPADWERGQAIAELARNKRLEIVHAMLAILQLRDFYQPREFPGFKPPPQSEALFAKKRERLSPVEIARLNRIVLERSLPGHIRPNKFVQDSPAIHGYAKGLRTRNREPWPVIIKNPKESLTAYRQRIAHYFNREPLLTVADIRDWWSFYPFLLAAGEDGAPACKTLWWHRLGAETVKAIRVAGTAIREANSRDSATATSMSKTLARLLMRRDLFPRRCWPAAGLPAAAREVLEQATAHLPDRLLEGVDRADEQAVQQVAVAHFSPSQAQTFNRALFDQAFGDQAFDDWRTFATRIVQLQAAQNPGPSPLQQRLLALLPPEVLASARVAVRAVQACRRQRRAVLAGINRLFDDRTLYDAQAYDGVELEEACTRLLKQRDTLAPQQLRAMNRMLFEAAFPGQVRRYYCRFWGEVPWGNWFGPLARWFLLALVVFTVFYALNELVFKQWYEREKVVFPIAKFTETILATNAEEGGSCMPRVFGNPFFWAGCAVAFCIMFYNGLIDAAVIQGIGKIELGDNKRNMNLLLQGTVLSPLGGSRVIRFHIFFTAIGLGFLLPTEVSFSIWFFYLVMMGQQMIAVWLGYGNNSSSFRQGWYSDASFMTAQGGGAMEIFGLIYLWRARRQLTAFLYRLARPKGSKHISGEEIREYTLPSLLFFLGSVAVLYFMLRGNASLPMAIFVYACVLFFTVAFVRLVAECGLISFQAFFGPLHIVKIFGLLRFPWAFAAKGLGTVLLFLSAFCLDTKVFIAPTMMNAKYLAARNRISGKSFVIGLFLAISVTLVTASVVTLAFAYDGGLGSIEQWFYVMWPKLTYKYMGRMIGHPESMSAFDPSLAGWFVGGAAACAGMIYLRQFLFWVPHPIGLVLFMDPQIAPFWFSFFIAWLCKKAAVRYLDSDGYAKASGFFIGLIVGEVLAVSLANIISITTATHIPMDLNRNI